MNGTPAADRRWPTLPPTTQRGRYYGHRSASVIPGQTVEEAKKSNYPDKPKAKYPSALSPTSTGTGS